MNQFQIPKELINATQIFQIERSKTIIGEAHGFFCGKNYPNTIQLIENTEIKNGDWLIDSTTGQRYYSVDTHPIVIHGVPSNWMVKYQTENQYNSSRNSSSTIFNIQSVNGTSVIGNQEKVVLNVISSLSDIEQLIHSLPDSDKAKANELLAELHKTESSNHPVLVEGALSKFSDLIKKHSDLLTAVGGWAVKLLIGN